jgi:predicted small lipoprotein YifL
MNMKRTILWLLLLSTLAMPLLGCAKHYYQVPDAASERQTADEIEWGDDPWR